MGLKHHCFNQNWLQTQTLQSLLREVSLHRMLIISSHDKLTSHSFLGYCWTGSKFYLHTHCYILQINFIWNLFQQMSDLKTGMDKIHAVSITHYAVHTDLNIDLTQSSQWTVVKVYIFCRKGKKTDFVCRINYSYETAVEGRLRKHCCLLLQFHLQPAR